MMSDSVPTSAAPNTPRFGEPSITISYRSLANTSSEFSRVCYFRRITDPIQPAKKSNISMLLADGHNRRGVVKSIY